MDVIVEGGAFLGDVQREGCVTADAVQDPAEAGGPDIQAAGGEPAPPWQGAGILGGLGGGPRPRLFLFGGGAPGGGGGRPPPPVAPLDGGSPHPPPVPSAPGPGGG